MTQENENVPEPSQRAKEVARDLFERLQAYLEEKGLQAANLRFHIDSTDISLRRDEAERWILDVVDTGFPRVGFYVEARVGDTVVVNLAAFDDPDSQYWE